MLRMLLLLVACAHQPATVATSDDALGSAYDQVASGKKPKARSGGYLIEKSGDSVRVVREAPSGGVGPDVTDAWITARVKGKLAGVEVDSKDGVVTLRGNVASRDQAMKALRDSLATDGVTGVRSELQYPGVLRARF